MIEFILVLGVFIAGAVFGRYGWPRLVAAIKDDGVSNASPSVTTKPKPTVKPKSGGTGRPPKP